MAVTFPMSLAELGDLFPAGSFTMELIENQNVSGLASGESIAVNRMPTLWAGSAKSIPMRHIAAQELAASFRMLDGVINQFFLYDMRKKYPAADLDGSVFGAATPTIASVRANNKSLDLAGLPAGYTLTAGDRWSAIYNTSRVFYGEFSKTKTADGSGSISDIEVRPHLRPGFSSGVAITIVKPACKVKLQPGSLRVDGVGNLFSTVSFSFQQTLAQD